MKNTNIRILSTLVITVVFCSVIYCSCNKEPEYDIFSTNLKGATVVSTEVISYANKEAVFELGIATFDPQKIYGNQKQKVDNFNESDIKEYAANYDYYIQNIDIEEPEAAEDYSNAIMIDRSFGTPDPDEINCYLRNVRSNDEYILSSFSYEDDNDTVPLTIYSDGFYNDYAKSMEELSDIYSQESSGESSLYDALDQMLDYVNTNASKDSKYITVFIGEMDQKIKSIPNGDLLISKAISYNIKINIYFIYFDEYNERLNRITTKTNGFMMETVFPGAYCLANLLSNNYYLYKTRIKIINNGGGIFTQGKYYADYFTLFIVNEVYFYLEFN
ncbi:hypothetical protein ACFLRI_03860 [Bacteroidota bacterium]